VRLRPGKGAGVGKKNEGVEGKRKGKEEKGRGFASSICLILD